MNALFARNSSQHLGLIKQIYYTFALET